jgi:two-component system nitrogen regulation response regulator GlnG
LGRSKAIETVRRTIRKISRVPNATVLLTGESGTGKSLLARAIHDLCDRRQQPFVAVNPADLETPAGITALFERAGGGTLVIDEIADMNAGAQKNLLGLIDRAGKDAPRLIVTTRADLAAKMESGEFREDLFYRVSGVIVALPTLRDRVEDIALLTRYFLAGSARDGAPPHHMSKRAAALLNSYTWPGNVRQLENCLKRLAVTARHEEITLAEVREALNGQPAVTPGQSGHDREKLSQSIARHLRRYFDLHGGSLPPPGLYGRILHEMELPLLEIALEATGGNQAKCADLLGINRNTLRKKISGLEIRVTRRRKLM